MNYIQKTKKIVRQLQLEAAPEIDLNEAMFFSTASYSFTVKQNSSDCKDKGMTLLINIFQKNLNTL